MPALGETEWQEHAALVGAVTLAWNQTVHQLLRVFCHLTGLESPLAEAIFFSPQSDSAQRNLVKRVAAAVGLAELDWKTLEKLFKRLEKASRGRNLATHMIFGITAFDQETGMWGPKVVPSLTPPQDSRLEADFTAQFRKVEHELMAIHRDLEHWLGHTPFPDRPWGGPPFPRAAAARMDALAQEAGLPSE